MKNPLLPLSAFFMLLLGHGFATGISSCNLSITSPGTYALTGNISADSMHSCLYIKASDVTIDCRGHWILGNDQDCTPAGRQCAGIWSVAQRTKITNCYIRKFQIGIGLGDYTTRDDSSSNYTSIDNVSIWFNTVEAGLGEGIGIMNSKNVNITNSYINGTESNLGDAIYFDGGKGTTGNFIIENNTILSDEFAISFYHYPGSGLRTQNISIKNNYIRGVRNGAGTGAVTYTGISESNYNDNVTINGNVFDQGGIEDTYGLQINPGSTGSAVTNNTFIGPRMVSNGAWDTVFSLDCILQMALAYVLQLFGAA